MIQCLNKYNEFTYLKNFLITGSSYVPSGGVCVPK